MSSGLVVFPCHQRCGGLGGSAEMTLTYFLCLLPGYYYIPEQFVPGIQ